ncbi:hypothetical protein LUW77_03125 [Streptomyces radiopugnans]|nr:hypothetical protein LUW77_03125 [Streptomyces radiopugnans]
MPHNVKVWVDDSPDEFIVYIDAGMISDEGARFVEALLNATACHWNRSPARIERPHLRLHTG